MPSYRNIQEYQRWSEEKRNQFFEIYKGLNPYKKEVFKYILNKKRHQKHRLHVVSPSPWPIYSAACAFLFVLGMVQYMHGYGAYPLICGVISLISAFYFWFRDIIREGLYMGYHTKIVNSCLRFGFVLFLVSEVMFFFGFFWALLHYTLTPSIFGGGIWPPQGIVLYLMSENVNVPLSLNRLIKAQTPMLISEAHAVPNFVWDDKDMNLLYWDHDMRWMSDNEYIPAPWRRTRDYWIEITRTEDVRAMSHIVPISINSALYYPTLLYFFNRNYYAESGVYGFGVTNVHINLHCHGVLINPYKVPLLNTAVLVTSGFILTMAHSYLRVEFFRACYRFMIGTVAFGLYFIMLQAYEYTYSGFSMNDGVYGSIFYMLTGFHGFHVIIGTIFLIVVTCRLRLSHFTANNHFAFEAAAWYWHFVDVVWILLYLLLYLWPNARYFSKGADISFDVNTKSIYIDMTGYYYIHACNHNPKFSIPTNVNFEYAPKLKVKVVKDILAHFENRILSFEELNGDLLDKRYTQEVNKWKSLNNDLQYVPFRKLIGERQRQRREAAASR